MTIQRLLLTIKTTTMHLWNVVVYKTLVATISRAIFTYGRTDFVQYLHNILMGNSSYTFEKTLLFYKRNILFCIVNSLQLRIQLGFLWKNNHLWYRDTPQNWCNSYHITFDALIMIYSNTMKYMMKRWNSWHIERYCNWQARVAEIDQQYMWKDQQRRERGQWKKKTKTPPKKTEELTFSFWTLVEFLSWFGS